MLALTNDLLCQQQRMSEQHAAARVGQDVQNCLYALGVVNGDSVGLQAHDRQVCENPFRAVGGEDSDLLLRL
ncbi:hypothetical protein SAMN02745165_02071 [Malonomonas rubra DSM 5091]|uniref:Uncharacterized protein n=1 Tax=Malonomonas rubra DSM 5091 TaxID=1122189 RepID=A0A1M6I9F1_MALRU|nr:hypothetical protein SAMN02745165_02071 [Malonomonas rubra DSM 5091]